MYLSSPPSPLSSCFELDEPARDPLSQGGLSPPPGLPQDLSPRGDKQRGREGREYCGREEMVIREALWDKMKGIQLRRPFDTQPKTKNEAKVF